MRIGNIVMYIVIYKYYVIINFQRILTMIFKLMKRTAPWKFMKHWSKRTKSSARVPLISIRLLNPVRCFQLRPNNKWKCYAVWRPSGWDLAGILKILSICKRPSSTKLIKLESGLDLKAKESCIECIQFRVGLMTIMDNNKSHAN